MRVEHVLKMSQVVVSPGNYSVCGVQPGWAPASQLANHVAVLPLYHFLIMD